MASKLYTVDIPMNINTGCFVCEDKEFHKAHGLCCDLVAALQSNFFEIFSLRSTRYDSSDQKKLQDIVIKLVVLMLQAILHKTISRYQFCQINDNDLQIVAEMSVSDFRRTSETNMRMNMKEIENLEKEIFDTLKLLQTVEALQSDFLKFLQSDFLKFLPLYSGRYDTGEQKTLLDIVIKNVVKMLHARTELDDKNPISRYQFCPLNNNDLRNVADMSVSDFRRFSKTNMIMNINEIQNRQKEIVNTLKLLRTGFNREARMDKSQAADKRSLDFLRNIKLQNSYRVCFE